MGKDRPVFRLVRQLDALGCASKNDGMLANHRAAAQRCKADIPGRSRASQPVAPALGMAGKVNATPGGGSLAQQQGGS